MDDLENIHRDNNMSDMFINRLSDSKTRYKLAQEMPFLTGPDYEMLREYSTQISDIFKIFNNNNFARQIESIVNNFTNENYNCKYHNDRFSFRPSFISAHDVIAGKKMDSCKQRSAVKCIEDGAGT